MNFRLRSSYLWIALLASYLFIVVGLAIQLQDGLGFISFKSPVRYFYDAYDVRVYFASSNWLGDLSRLYVSVPSEYPLAANYVFLAARNISEILPGSIDEFRRFQIVWTAMAAFMYCACLCVVRSLPDQKNIRLVIWLSPAIVYYSLFRFDIYVALPLMVFMLLVMRERFWLGSLLVGVAIALKGFAVVVLPALFFFIFGPPGGALGASIFVYFPYLGLLLLLTTAATTAPGAALREKRASVVLRFFHFFLLGCL